MKEQNKPENNSGCYWPAGVFLIGALLILFFSCNHVKGTQASEQEVAIRKSGSVYEESNLASVDTSKIQESTTSLYHTGDSVLDSELEIVMQNQKDYANGDTSNRFPPRPVYSDFVVKRKGDSVISINAGGRNIESVRLKDKKKGSVVDSTTKILKEENKYSYLDLLRIADSTHTADSLAMAAKNKGKETVRLAPVFMICASIAAIIIIALLIAVRYYKKKAAAGIKKDA